MTIEHVPVSGEGRLWTEKSGDGAPMILLHGSVHDSRLWDGMFPELGLHHTAITVVVGDHDHPEIGVIARRLAEGIPGGRLEIVAGADHYLPLRAPERLTEILVCQ
ncbi:alpha/beta fold hydrolase [Kutzneria sp. CA-103260]|uniref:alpha/beta fold hydrolase n=1 Tax=Kutzneria sp. CA-103260 TaxID=2802641 RepID=UPI001BA79EDB|nr:hypothetical protein [Kutzneria sp. CA-103260]QUQ65612.1 hypothetical protein JJ691_33360 [Kutzneria sp. CA-103260]